MNENGKPKEVQLGSCRDSSTKTDGGIKRRGTDATITDWWGRGDELGELDVGQSTEVRVVPLAFLQLSGL